MSEPLPFRTPYISEDAVKQIARMHRVGLPHGNGESILVVDDEKIIRETCKRMLVNHGYQVVLAVDGEQALDHLNAHPQIQLVISDLCMPRMGGLELVQHIRILFPGKPIGLISGYFDDHSDLPAVEFFLAKPFTTLDLLGCVKEVLHRDSCSKKA